MEMTRKEVVKSTHLQKLENQFKAHTQNYLKVQTAES